MLGGIFCEKIDQMKILERHIWSLVNVPYIWAGDDPSGFDCSGLIIELMQGSDILPRQMTNKNGYLVPFDTTAQGLHKIFEANGVINSKGLGALIFFGKGKTKITHVGIMVDNTRMLEAGGGGKHIKTIEDAIKYNAFTRIRPITWRKDFVAIIKPRYALFN